MLEKIVTAYDDNISGGRGVMTRGSHSQALITLVTLSQSSHHDLGVTHSS